MSDSNTRTYASEENPLPRKSNDDGYTVKVEELAERLGWSVDVTRKAIIDPPAGAPSAPYRPWFGGQVDIKPADADQLVAYYRKQGAR